jgi:subtilisin family serine protease
MDWLARPAIRRHRTSRPLAAPEQLERRAVLSVAAYAAGDDPILATALPNDPSFSMEWSLQNTGQSGGTAGIDIGAARAWDITTGSRSVVVAVIDSGIDLTHPDLAANLWTNPGEVAGNGIDDDRNGFVDDIHGWNFVDNNANVQDGYGHGTHVAGIIGAVGNNGVGVTGVAWRVSLMVLRIQNDSGVGSTSALIGALRYATTMRRDFGINVVVTNNSWEAAAGYSSVIEGLIREQGAAGITFVAAAGNHGTDSNVIPRYPGNYDLPNVIAVASLGSSGVLAGSSNYGATTVDLAAPGTFILSTWKGGGYVALSGTSMAAPHVSGTVALLAAAKPGITVAEVRGAILGTTAPLASLAGKTATGGRLNAFAALASLGVAPAPVPPPTTPVARVVVSPAVSSAVSLPFADEFATAGPLAADWVCRIGGFTAADGAAVSTGAGGSIATLRGTAVAHSVQRALVSLGTGRSVGIVARYAGPGDQSMYLAQLTRGTTGFFVQIFRQSGGRWTLLSMGRVYASRGWLRFDVVGGQLTARFNGRVVAAAVDYTIAAAGSVGMRAVGAGARYEAYSAT